MAAELCGVNREFSAFKKKKGSTCLYADGNDIVKRAKLIMQEIKMINKLDKQRIWDPL